jgi:hypothetical protein
MYGCSIMKATCVDNAAFITQCGREQKCVVASDLKKRGARNCMEGLVGDGRILLN